ncbi:MAG: T9SS type A sorting domain-containing protein [Bacteroidia bacterium]
MKKLILTVSLLATLAISAFAQPVLDQTAVGQPGDIFYLGIQDTFAPGFSIGSPGANQTWDFSNLLVNGTDTIWYLDPINTTYGSNFPAANLAMKQASLGDGEAFLESTNNHLDILGVAGDLLGTGSPMVIPQNPPSRLAQFPFTYGNSFTNTTVIDITADASGFGVPFVDSARYKNIQDRVILADGYGSLILPAGTFNAVLRTKDIIAQKDSIWIHSFLGWSLYQDSSYTDSTFTWWNGSKGYYMAQASYIGGALNTMRYEDPVIVGRPEPSANLYQVYPNPAQDRLRIQADGKVRQVVITDLQGREVMRSAVNGASAEFDVAALPRGYYLYALLDRNQTRLQSGKLLLGN